MSTQIDTSEGELGEATKHELLCQAASVMAPRESYPRRVGGIDKDFKQLNVDRPFDLTNTLTNADEGAERFVSVYGFPNGHPKYGGIPRIDTLFIDLDIPSRNIYNLTGEEDDWLDAIRPLLMTVSNVARDLVSEGKSTHWRAVLSGHKGVHLYCDFPPLEVDDIDGNSVRQGLLAFAHQVIDRLDMKTPFDLWEYVDTNVLGDLSRLCRMPNTIHPKATGNFKEPRYCVPVEIETLIGLSPEEYAELCRTPSMPDAWRRNEAKMARFIAEQSIYSAVTNTGKTTTRSDSRNERRFDSSRVRTYKREQEGDMSVSDIWFLLEQTPCIKAYADRDDQFAHGQQSHMFELFVMRHLIERRIPYKSIVDFFRSMDGFDEVETRYRLNYLIASHDDPIPCETVWNHASEFCLGDQCSYYRRHKP